jgi:hypothetical protein
MCYGALNKGTQALWLEVRIAAQRLGIAGILEQQLPYIRHSRSCRLGQDSSQQSYIMFAVWIVLMTKIIVGSLLRSLLPSTAYSNSHLSSIAAASVGPTRSRPTHVVTTGTLLSWSVRWCPLPPSARLVV